MRTSPFLNLSSVHVCIQGSPNSVWVLHRLSGTKQWQASCPLELCKRSDCNGNGLSSPGGLGQLLVAEVEAEAGALWRRWTKLLVTGVGRQPLRQP